jgi:hypothetical protein
MKCFGFLGAVSVLCWLGAVPVAAHDCCHRDHHYCDDCWDCGHYYQQGMSRQSMGSSTAGGVTDPRTLEGRITEVIYLPGPTPESAMVEIHLQSGGQTSLIRLAPSGYLRKSEIRLREGEPITVKGFPVAGMEGDLIVATEIHQAGKGLNLRDGRGRSMW